MSRAELLSLALPALWLLLVWIIPMLRAEYRRHALRAMVVVGVPILGWLTLYWGPIMGIGAFAVGLILLVTLPSGTARRPTPPAQGEMP
ncbi:DUF2484 family protein [Paracoccus caeni]|uniref:DUF2484 family protein n=1 Tax=Paracoccus caeni TaxID=657651 RepID=A0A934SAA4_9RHOB|nr:DUF2484 family protein [Paracoccus caeni]MBK4215255.1 DUF2484 family protein [Paracoccus caeni]